MKLSVVIPVWNEERRIGATLDRIRDYLATVEYEILVVDDGSTDATARIVSEYPGVRLLQYKRNRGKGYAVKQGLLQARYPLVLYTDSDLATPIEELEKLMAFVERYDVVIASRNLAGSKIMVQQPLYRQVMGKGFPLLVNMLALRGFRDTQCGFKLFRTSVARKIVGLQTFDGFSFDVELLVIATRLGYKIKEVPVVWIDKKGSTVRPLRDGAGMLLDLLRLNHNRISGKYRVR
ncbi:MAG: dolichyl-phosphate beta-glucosyltransferase [Nanobdellota archaeon]